MLGQNTIGLIIIILLIIIFMVTYKRYDRYRLKPWLAPKTLTDDSTKHSKIKWNDLSDGEKLNALSSAYFPTAEEIDAVDPQIAIDDKFIAALPQDNTTCTDKYAGCAAWASNDECEINAEFMLYNCAKSCKACSLTADQKSNLDRIYNSRDPPHCVYHGEPYPGETSYINQMFETN